MQRLCATIWQIVGNKYITDHILEWLKAPFELLYYSITTCFRISLTRQTERQKDKDK